MTTTLKIGGVQRNFKRLVIDDYVKSIPQWNVEFAENYRDIDGFDTVNIYKEGYEILRGYVTRPKRTIGSQGQVMPVGGLEWTGRLKLDLTPHSSISESTVSDALTTILEDSRFSLGDIDSFEVTGDPYVWDTTLEFLEFTFSDAAIVYGTTEEVTEEVSTTNVDMSPPNRRGCYWYDGATKRFYVIVYDTANTKLQYSYSADGETWSAYADFAGATPAAGEGAAGAYGVYWDGTTLHIVLDDGGGNVDYWTGAIADATGVITLTKTSNDFDAGNLVCGPIEDSQGDIWCIVDDGANYVLWEYAGAAWNNRANAANEAKWMCPGPSDGDVVVIEWDSVEGDIEEYLWDRSAGTYTHQRDVVSSISGTSIGYISGYTDDYGNLFIMWEDVYGAGDADIRFSRRYYDNAAWDTSTKVVDDNNYQTPGNFSVSGDASGNIYLFYQYERSTGSPSLHMVRYLEEAWGSSVQLDVNCFDGDGIDSPFDNLALFVVWKDDAEDLQFSLMAPHGWMVDRQYELPSWHRDFDGGDAYTGTYVSAGKGEIVENNGQYPRSGYLCQKATLDAGTNDGYALGYILLSDIGITGELVYTAARKVRWNRELDTNGDAFHIMRVGETSTGWSVAFAGVYRQAGVDYWAIYYWRDGIGLAWSVSATVANPNTNYDVEIATFRDNAAGYVYLWVDGALVHSVSGFDNLGSERELLYASFGLAYSDAPSTGELTLWMDDCRVHDERIGDEDEGYYRSDLYTASGGIVAWGSLAAVDARIREHAWYIYDNVPALVLGPLTTTVDLDAAGLPVGTTQIYIYCANQHLLKAWYYVSEISLSERAENVSLETDYENCYVGIKKMADVLGAEFRLDWDDTIDFQTRLGEDKSASIILFTSRSQSAYPDKTPNITIVNREEDYDGFANAVKVLGAGDYPDRIEASAQDETSQDTYEIVAWKRVVNKDLSTVGMAEEYAGVYLASVKDPIERISVEFLDPAQAGQLVAGDTVTIVDENTELNDAVRVVRVIRGYDGAGLETVSAELNRKMRGSEFVNELVKSYDLERWV